MCAFPYVFPCVILFHKDLRTLIRAKKVEVKDLVFVIEGLHGEKFYRVDLVFLCEYIGELENAILQSDTNQVGYDWLDIKTLNTTPLYPSKLRRQIMNLYERKAYKVYLGNEEIGAPEVTD